jgi:hypothetical protein
VGPLLNDDQETIVRTLERLRSILCEHIAGHRDAAWAIERVHSTLNKADVVRALDRFGSAQNSAAGRSEPASVAGVNDAILRFREWNAMRRQTIAAMEPSLSTIRSQVRLSNKLVHARRTSDFRIRIG